jgi:hypothetical protein
VSLGSDAVATNSKESYIAQIKLFGAGSVRGSRRPDPFAYPAKPSALPSVHHPRTSAHIPSLIELKISDYLQSCRMLGVRHLIRSLALNLGAYVWLLKYKFEAPRASRPSLARISAATTVNQFTRRNTFGFLLRLSRRPSCRREAVHGGYGTAVAKSK